MNGQTRADEDSPSFWYGSARGSEASANSRVHRSEPSPLSLQRSFEDSIERALFGRRSALSQPTSPLPFDPRVVLNVEARSSPPFSLRAQSAQSARHEQDVEAVADFMRELEEEEDGDHVRDSASDLSTSGEDDESDDFDLEPRDDHCGLQKGGFTCEDDVAQDPVHVTGIQNCQDGYDADSAGLDDATTKQGSDPWSLRGSVKAQAAEHRRRLCSHFSGFSCNCTLARQQGLSSCLDNFTMLQLRQLSALSYGTVEEAQNLSVKEVKARIHSEIWSLKSKSNRRSGAVYEVTEWKVHGQPVCKRAFIVALGGTSHAHREALALTKRGIAPGEAAACCIAKEAAAKMQQVRSPATEWAVSWWCSHLRLHDFLPNECAIQYRGTKWRLVHSQMYLPVAKAAGKPLLYRQWRRARGKALAVLQQELYQESPAGKKLRLVRSARHSKFPECTDCLELRKAYINVASKLTSDPKVVEEHLRCMLEHARDWQADRETALRIRHTCTLESNSIYECDDKCGSYWQRLPIGETGRDSKADSTAVYRFSIQANVIAGPQGIIRFTCIPKNIKTGANFGLTNLFACIVGAKESGRLPLHCTHIYRHTDGGPDNVAITSHIFHWLLVYLGVFQKITWFRFKAGHSHTEVADRLFSLMKKLFESDGPHRVIGIQDIPQLIEKLTEVFSKEVERFQFVFNFANWDFDNWLEQSSVGELGRISSARVFTYTYVEDLWEHGCVKVQYKSTVAWRGNSLDAEYAPVVEETREVPTMGGTGFTMEKVNVSTRCGVIFMKSPPDLTTGPPELESFNNDFDPGMTQLLVTLQHIHKACYAAENLMVFAL